MPPQPPTIDPPLPPQIDPPNPPIIQPEPLLPEDALADDFSSTELHFSRRKRESGVWAAL
jgi:hypothetical protein